MKTIMTGHQIDDETIKPSSASWIWPAVNMTLRVQSCLAAVRAVTISLMPTPTSLCC